MRWSWWALNPRPVAHKTTALTTELQDPGKLVKLLLFNIHYHIAYWASAFPLFRWTLQSEIIMLKGFPNEENRKC